MNFFFNDTATTEIYTLSLHDALPISGGKYTRTMFVDITERVLMEQEKSRLEAQNIYLQEEIRSEHDFTEIVGNRSEEHTSELQSPDHLVCRLLLEKKKNKEHLYAPLTRVPPHMRFIVLSVCAFRSLSAFTSESALCVSPRQGGASPDPDVRLARRS